MGDKLHGHPTKGQPYPLFTRKINKLPSATTEPITEGMRLNQALVNLQSQILGTNGIIDRLNNLEQTYVYYEIFQIITNITGSVSIPNEAEILFDRYKGAGDAIVVKTDSENRPIDEAAYSNSGEVIMVLSFDSNGNYVLSASPNQSVIAIVYQIKIPLQYTSNINMLNVLTSHIQESNAIIQHNVSSTFNINDFNMDNCIIRNVSVNTVNVTINAGGFIKSPIAIIKAGNGDIILNAEIGVTIIGNNAIRTQHKMAVLIPTPIIDTYEVYGGEL